MTEQYPCGPDCPPANVWYPDSWTFLHQKQRKAGCTWTQHNQNKSTTRRWLVVSEVPQGSAVLTQRVSFCTCKASRRDERARATWRRRCRLSRRRRTATGHDRFTVSLIYWFLLSTWHGRQSWPSSGHFPDISSAWLRCEVNKYI